MTEPTSNRAARRTAERRRRRVRAVGAALASGTAALGTTAALVGVAGPAGAATITVLNLDDAGAGSLRQALADADDGDVIEFATGLTGTISLLSTLQVEDGVTIVGPGASAVTLDGGDNVRIMNIDPVNVGRTVAISGLTFSRGSFFRDGAALRFDDNSSADSDALVLTDTVFTDNTVTGEDSGGAVYADQVASVTITNSTFTGNYSYYYGGAVATKRGQTLVVSGSTFIDNEAKNEEGGALYVDHFVSVTVVDSTFTDNRAEDDDGGAVFVRSTPHVTIERSTFSGNFGDTGGGAVQIDTSGGVVLVRDSVFSENRANSAGGAVAFNADSSSSVTVDHSVISDNTATGIGGGLYVDMYSTGDLTVSNSTISGNSGSRGGGMVVDSPGTVVVTASTLDGNTATDQGGGLNVDTSSDAGASGSVTITNSTISGNTAGSAGGGVAVTYSTSAYVDDQTTPPLSVLQSTITGNTATAGAGIGVSDRYTGPGSVAALDDDKPAPAPRPAVAPVITLSPVGIVGSIVSANPGGDVDTPGPLTGRAALVGTVTGSPLTDLGGTITSGDPGLDPLADNGGPTRTHALKPTSAAVDTGPDPVPDFPGNTTDQRGAGYPRVSGGRADIGAYELEVPEPTFTG